MFSGCVSTGTRRIASLASEAAWAPLRGGGRYRRIGCPHGLAHDHLSFHAASAMSTVQGLRRGADVLAAAGLGLAPNQEKDPAR